MAEEAGAGRLGIEVVGCGPARRRVTEQVPQVFVLRPKIWGHATAHGGPSRDLLIQVEAPRGCGDADLPVLSSDHKQVHEVPVHLAVPRRWVPAAHGEHFQTLQGLQKWPDMKRQVFWDPNQSLASLMFLKVLPSSHGSGAAGDTVAAPGSLAGYTQVACSQWGPSPSPSSVSHCLREPRLAVSQEPTISMAQCGPGLP